MEVAETVGNLIFCKLVRKTFLELVVKKSMS